MTASPASDAEVKSSTMYQSIKALRDSDPTLFQKAYTALLTTESDEIAALEQLRNRAYEDFVERLRNGWRRQELTKSQFAKRGRQLKKFPAVVEKVWLSVKFLCWRDKIGITKACERLAIRGVHLQVYDTPDGRWNGEGDEPPVLWVHAEGEPGNAEAHNLRQTYYRYKNLSLACKQSAAIALRHLQDGYEGKPSGYTRAMVDLIYPPA